VRDYWRGCGGSLSDFSFRLSGSPDLYELDRRRPTASINFVACHDGFTLTDLVSYNETHNDANLEWNADGENHNRSWDCGDVHGRRAFHACPDQDIDTELS